jgi:hypothetical protein
MPLTIFDGIEPAEAGFSGSARFAPEIPMARLKSPPCQDFAVQGRLLKLLAGFFSWGKCCSKPQ